MPKLQNKNIHIDEGDKRLSDKGWRLNHLYKIKSINKEVIPFRLNRAQAHFKANKHNRNIILKSRKLGFTTYFAIDGLDETLFVKNTDALMLSYDIPSQLDIFDDKIVMAWENLHDELKELYTLDAERANKLKFNWGGDSKGNKTTSSITVRLHGRSGTFSRLHISEFGKICKVDPAAAKEIISGTIQAVPLEGEVNIESTAEGDYGDFHDMFMEAYKRGDPKTPVDFKAHFYNWQYDDAELSKIVPMDPDDMPKEFAAYKKEHSLSDREITYYYYKWLTLARDWKALRREYPTTVEEAFEGSGERFFDEDSVRGLEARDGAATGHAIYYADYRPGHRYAAAVDPSEGIGQDNAVVAIWDFDAKDKDGHPRPEVVAMYVDDRTKPDDLAYVAKDMATRYGNCIIAVERNNHGHTTLAILKGIYYNIYKEKKTGQSHDADTERLGWHSNSATKGVMLYGLRTALLERSVSIPDIAAQRELLTYPAEEVTNFSKDDGGKHWDRVSAIAIGYQMKQFASVNKLITASSDEDFDPFKVF